MVDEEAGNERKRSRNTRVWAFEVLEGETKRWERESESDSAAMRLLQSISGTCNRSLVLRALSRRHLASASASASTEEYKRRNYADNVTEYNGVVSFMSPQRRFHFLLRDVYDDMMLDGVQPNRDTFHSLILGTMKGARLQDAFYFTHQMKSMGLVPDVGFLSVFVELNSILCYMSIQCVWFML